MWTNCSPALAYTQEAEGKADLSPKQLRIVNIDKDESEICGCFRLLPGFFCLISALGHATLILLAEVSG